MLSIQASKYLYHGLTRLYVPWRDSTKNAKTSVQRCNNSVGGGNVYGRMTIIRSIDRPVIRRADIFERHSVTFIANESRKLLYPRSAFGIWSNGPKVGTI